mmetsp:Transcript_36666/g.77364  ORF Transcript_36666/g.77364 Transcript_36666/m.77364 type:complete len:227 (-) Transcript_36666:748-1428(-)
MKLVVITTILIMVAAAAAGVTRDTIIMEAAVATTTTIIIRLHHHRVQMPRPNRREVRITTRLAGMLLLPLLLLRTRHRDLRNITKLAAPPRPLDGETRAMMPTPLPTHHRRRWHLRHRQHHRHPPPTTAAIVPAVAAVLPLQRRKVTFITTSLAEIPASFPPHPHLSPPPLLPQLPIRMGAPIPPITKRRTYNTAPSKPKPPPTPLPTPKQPKPPSSPPSNPKTNN